MAAMVVTLEVSKLSGWLNTRAYCRESKGGHPLGGELREGRREAAGDCGARSVQARARLQIIGGRARGRAEERTRNISLMVVTLEVSKLSGWLNADAPCRESKGGHPLGGELREGRWQAAGDRSAQTQRAR